MSDPKKISEATNAMVASHRERARLFERLADPRLTDEERQSALDLYSTASDAFDKAKADALKLASKPPTK